jgi:hypothetical protein
MGLKAKIRETALDAALEAIKETMGEEDLREFADMIIDWVEERVEASENTIDDALVLPACALVRKAFGIPDNDEVEEVEEEDDE